MAVHELPSPDGRVCVRLSIEPGELFWEVWRDGVCAVAPSPLGIRLEGCDLSRGLA